MHASKIQLERCFLCSIDSAKSFVEYNEYTLDMDSQMYAYMLQLFARNFDNTSAKKSFFNDESFIASILPDRVENFDAFVDVVADEIHTLVVDAVDLPSGSGLFLWATVEEQPFIAFFKLNYQKKYTCLVDDDKQVVWKEVTRLLPTYTQKEYDYFFINILDKKVWMSDTKCHIDNMSVNYMSERILKLEEGLKKSEKEVLDVINEVAVETIREFYPREAPKKIFEYRQSVADEAVDYGNISPVVVEDKVFFDNEEAKKVYHEKLESREIPVAKPLMISSKSKRQLQKKQKIVTENGIEILVPVEYLDDKSVFDFQQNESGSVSIVINDVGGNLK